MLPRPRLALRPLLFACALGLPLSLPAAPKPILVVTTDIGGDPDDQQSLRRLLLYTNEVDLRGLIASATGTPGEVRQPVTRPELIREIIDDYARVQPNLQRHADGFPSAEHLHGLVAAGDPVRTVESIRPGAGTDGSRLLTRVVNEADHPVHLAIWGGARELAQALVDARHERTPEQLAAFVGRLRVYAIGDQDGYNRVIDGKRVDAEGTGKWIKDNFPTLRYVETNPPEINRFSALFRGMYQNDSAGGTYPQTALVRPGLEVLTQEAWVKEHVRENHGPLGTGYPLVNQNPRAPRNTRGVKEGDTPSWFYVLPLGLNDPGEPTWGGWGGRFEASRGNHYIDGRDRHWSDAADEATERKWTVARWREAYQNDFAARMDWCVQPAGQANRPPKVTLSGSQETIRRLRVQPGETLTLAAQVADPDGDPVSARWWLYADVTGVAASDVTLTAADSLRAQATFTPASSGRTYHFIVEATDEGSPRLTRYGRVVVEVAPRR